VSLAQAPGSAKACEVTIHVSLREGLTPNITGYSLIATGGGVMTGFIGALIAKKAMLLAGAALAGSALAAGLVVGVALMALAGPLYRWEIRKTETELQAALASVDAALRSIDIFGDAPTPPLPRPHDAGADLLML
jgi:hypothetical protein